MYPLTCPRYLCLPPHHTAPCYITPWQLRSFCLESTIWFDPYQNGPHGAYVGAYLEMGFAAPVLVPTTRYQPQPDTSHDPMRALHAPHTQTGSDTKGEPYAVVDR